MVVLDLASDHQLARDLVAGGVFVPDAVDIGDECTLVLRNGDALLKIPALCVYVAANGSGLQLVGCDADMKQRIIALAAGMQGGGSSDYSGGGGDRHGGDHRGSGGDRHGGDHRGSGGDHRGSGGDHRGSGGDRHGGDHRGGGGDHRGSGGDHRGSAGDHRGSAGDYGGHDHGGGGGGTDMLDDASTVMLLRQAAAQDSGGMDIDTILQLKRLGSDDSGSMDIDTIMQLQRDTAQDLAAEAAFAVARAGTGASVPLPPDADTILGLRKSDDGDDGPVTEELSEPGDPVTEELSEPGDPVTEELSALELAALGQTDTQDGDASNAESERKLALNVHERLRGLTLVQQMKIAQKGEVTERVVLERMYGKNVWEPLLRNPRITGPEVARIARMGALPRPLVELIVGNGGWLQIPEVRRALLSNPRLGTDQILRVLRLLPKHELKLAGLQTAYPHAVRDAAKRMLREMGG